ncbi:MAG: 30S ribosomal protein S17 [Candidatus Magasanikbacteria bacterium RIFCSPHIGHO2_01_FULL_41_23]|uniref:Small ribosomal subunit protein uS17 n=1 Tax=Candidatus Magasanikbacteria bacterium RIFCSPLOWO2_01_FULL_40_15 TaxID=1798686 RepID=A0A1F6N1W8_9BACT|nr:MAG: 30S ribosomal protein S17 [Candidatus Magasanikbacteria bacterium RIFCSPHIGHO2_01_FULL_41_23]OGH66820.1 MAG: 30S ribosomal protein S17 [Candidatus Magasanikbacteria bacterium RIFCSPHIGHO2_02_FULL_41_35]OGH76660.1 MAG: 30S ribosomal protein S17 [Candidatus Magasanikbacteria bacterium RIFCSPHIGHO2_12_FULL_41_16]OGH77996.1 MAG: 30S ribosomal protein S17 [Candidatus Magasanikbacteria bacterium RIFCSPLOWO2_01_FULL_40_15]
MKTQELNTKSTAQHRRFVGIVVRAKAQKTIAIEVEQKMMHPKYRKQYTHTTTYQVHDENAVAKVDDTVLFEECRPISKNKRWRLIEVLVRQARHE